MVKWKECKDEITCNLWVNKEKQLCDHNTSMCSFCNTESSDKQIDYWCVRFWYYYLKYKVNKTCRELFQQTHDDKHGVCCMEIWNSKSTLILSLVYILNISKGTLWMQEVITQSQSTCDHEDFWRDLGPSVRQGTLEFIDKYLDDITTCGCKQSPLQDKCKVYRPLMSSIEYHTDLPFPSGLRQYCWLESAQRSTSSDNSMDL